MADKKITSIDVAKRAGVSQSTVSRVFSVNSANVSEKATQRVLEAASELGYEPNIIARMMSTRQTNIIGLVMATITSPFYPYVLEKFLEELQALGKQVLLFTASKHQIVDDILPLALQYQVDALIITSATLSSEMATRAVESGTPVILFNRIVRDSSVNSVSADNLAGGRLAADILLDSAHQRLAFMAGVENTSTSHDRERGFVQRLNERTYHDLIRLQGDYTYESAHAATVKLLQRDLLPDALFCANDIMAIGAMDAIRQAGLCIPKDISVLGFDDIPMASWGSYQLTTISQNVDAMIQATIELMQAKIANPLTPSRTTHIAGELIVRSSVKNLHTSQE